MVVPTAGASGSAPGSPRGPFAFDCEDWGKCGMPAGCAAGIEGIGCESAGCSQSADRRWTIRRMEHGSCLRAGRPPHEEGQSRAAVDCRMSRQPGRRAGRRRRRGGSERCGGQRLDHRDRRPGSRSADHTEPCRRRSEKTLVAADECRPACGELRPSTGERRPQGDSRRTGHRTSTGGPAADSAGGPAGPAGSKRRRSPRTRHPARL